MELSLKEKGLLDAREKYGEEVERALREHLSLIGEDFYIWIANLYKPRKCVCDNFDADGNRVCLLKKDENGNPLCYGGGFYYSNSARDTEGFDIDIESTAQAMGFCSTSGLLEGYEPKSGAYPKQMRLDLTAFAKSLQSEDDGYFYHPRWGKSIGVSRKGRDLMWATTILRSFGDLPLYDTKNGMKGTLGAPKGEVSSEGESVSTGSWPEHLATLDAFREYLTTFDLKTKSYSTGNAINAQMGQIAARDKQAIADGEATDRNGDGIAEDGYIAAFEAYFNKHQNPENGTWEDELHYNSTNGLMKIAMVYNHLGIKLNYVEKAFKSAIEMALLPVGVLDSKGKTTTSAVDVYNPWVAMSYIRANVKKFGTEEESARLSAMLSENAVHLIRSTTEKTKKFKKADGSFGYTWSKSLHLSQGASVCPEGFVEGDVNGGTIAARGIFGNMCSCLELDIPLYSKDDFEKYISIIKKKYDTL